MRILVLSDTHGDISRAVNVYKKLVKKGPVDLIIHCGDLYSDAIKIGEITGARTAWVKGNCDGSFSEDDCLIVETEYGNLLVTHGHMQNVDFSQQNLYYMAEEKGCACALFGHTHRAVSTEAGGIHLMNPGSLTKPRDGSTGTFGLIITDTDYFRGTIYHYDQFMADGGDDGNSGNDSGKKSKVQGGYIRSLLNYSDRF